MVNDKSDFDLGADFCDGNYKSCFARSIAVNSSISHKQTTTGSSNSSKSLQVSSTHVNGHHGPAITSNGGNLEVPGSSLAAHSNLKGLGEVTVANQNGVASEVMSVGEVVVKLRRPLGICAEDTRRYSCNSGSAGSRRTSVCSSRIAEVPDVESVLLQSQVDTLHWQLKQTLESRKMYRNVMKQVVTFLDRAHRNLQLLGKKMNSTMPSSTVSRSKSEHHVNGYCQREGSISSATLPADYSDYESISEYSWKQSRKPDPPSPDEVPPEKLSQEAFRLLRTVQSLLNTGEPDLSSNFDQQNNSTNLTNDIEFLVQLAKEFPSQEPTAPTLNVPYRSPNRTTSFSLSPKLLTPEKDNPNNLHRLATAFNRKLSLQLSDSSTYSPSKHSTFNNLLQNSPRTSIAESEAYILSSTVLEDFKDTKASHKFKFDADIEFKDLKAPAKFKLDSENDFKDAKFKLDPQHDFKDPKVFKFEPEKSNSPPVSTVSSVEDESGFSSMNSFQEVGLPVPDDPKTALLKSMLHDGNVEGDIAEEADGKVAENGFSLWKKQVDLQNVNTMHKRWSSTPVDAISKNGDKQGLKVLWV